ncbi:MBL fold metallo-hydrolase [Sphingomonas aracearum]|uniref:MBL fold metallo-hydrolase n=1 Tax=Sphingomonas aracearum TaxID=2283317 RepID=A0A369W0B1_9SPHN|nr:MBL fold metallo-hydrolase [Sphingomonas aracearum]RDE07357.1 MBL fold metallo-hydrolase [Sphingomonas aracearum]
MAYKTQTFGPFEIIPLFDGDFSASTETLLHADGAEATERMRADWGGPTYEIPVYHFAVRTPDKLILVDAGTGTETNPTLGVARRSLTDAGIAPGDIDEIYVTHMHFDHALGLVEKGEAYFPRAQVYFAGRELEFYTDIAERDSRPEARRNGWKVAETVLNAYPGRVHAFDQARFPAGMSPYPLPGHTPAHTGFRLDWNGETLIFIGDAMHLVDAQSNDPMIGAVFDVDMAQGIASRRSLLEAASDGGWTLAGAHAPSFGRIERAGDRFRFVRI